MPGLTYIYHAIHSIENKVMRNNANEIQLIKKYLISTKTHQSVWAYLAVLFIVILAIGLKTSVEACRFYGL